MSNVKKFPKSPQYDIETDSSLIALMTKAVTDAFDGDEEEFEKAFAEAMAEQIVELADANDGFSVNLAEELTDAMRGVLLQWLGEHSCCPREDIDIFLMGVVGKH